MTTDHKPTVADELRVRADLVDAWDKFELGMEPPAPMHGRDTAILLRKAAAELDRRAAPEDWPPKCPRPANANPDDSIESCLRRGECGCGIAPGGHMLCAAPEAVREREFSNRPAAYQPGVWFDCFSIDEMQAFYLSRLPAIREAANECGYAIGLHGSTRRDMDLIAVPWREGYSDKDALARAIQHAACGLHSVAYNWEQKPAGRVAASFPICWPNWHDMVSAGHVDLSVAALLRQPAAAKGE